MESLELSPKKLQIFFLFFLFFFLFFQRLHVLFSNKNSPQLSHMKSAVATMKVRKNLMKYNKKISISTEVVCCCNNIQSRMFLGKKKSKKKKKSRTALGLLCLLRKKFRLNLCFPDGCLRRNKNFSDSKKKNHLLNKAIYGFVNCFSFKKSSFYISIKTELEYKSSSYISRKTECISDLIQQEK